jgi:VanZ family protein
VSDVHERDSGKRLWLAIAALVVVAAGLGSRGDALPLPDFVAKYAGDTLWAVLVFLLLAIAMPRRRAISIGALALGIAFGVELLQLYQAPWLNSIRATLPGRLVLGQGFLFSDLLCYTFGIGVAAIVYAAIAERSLRDQATILGAGTCVTVAVAVIASNLGQGPQLLGFVDRIPGRDKTGHFLLMGVLAFFLVLVIVPRSKSKPWKASLLVIALLCLVIGIEEGSQYFISTRTFSIADLLCSWGGVLVFGALAGWLVGRKSAR